MLLSEAMIAEHLDEFSSIGQRMQKLSSEVEHALSNQASVIAETIPAFTWKLLPEGQKPKDHIQMCRDSAQYYLNRVIQEFKKL